MPAFDSGAFDPGAFDAGAGGGQFVNPGFINQTAVAFTPTLVFNQEISLGLIDRTAVAFSPSFRNEILPGFIDQTAVVFAPSIGQGTTQALINQTAVIFAPTLQYPKYIDFGRIDRQALPYNPSLSGGVFIPPITTPATVVIRYDGTNITDDVMIVGAAFTSQANGVPGTCRFRIKDPDHSRSITTGKRLTLDINGERAWAGYVSKVSRVYPFPAQNTSNPSSVTRLLEVDGVDINILFKKRFVYEKANPKRLFGRKYTADNTDDTVAFADLVEDFLDLSGDNLDTSSLIENVGTINVDHPANPIGVGHEWASSMRSITALSNGIYYIDPDRKVVLTDVDTPNAPFDLSDDPADDAVGYRDMEIIYNASNMINDMIVWGAGKGSSDMVYSREEDATSISTHGRWQAGEFRGDMYKQGTVNRRADSIVQGSAQSKRGAKDDAIQVICTVFEPGLRVAQKVDFTSAAFGYQDVLPIRRQTITFISPTKPKYQIIAGHEIDMPWGFFDIYRYDVGGLPGVDIPGIEIEIPCLDCNCNDCEPGCECTDEVCGITDTFERTITGGFGTSDAGIPWTTVLGGSALGSFDVANGNGYIFTPGSSSGDTATATLGSAVPNEHYTMWDTTTIKTLRFQWSNIAWTSSDSEYLVNWSTVQRQVGGPVPSIYRLGANGWRLRTTGGPTDGTAIPDGFWNDSTIYTWTVEDIGGGDIETSITDGATTYSTTGAYTEDVVRCIISASSSLQSPFTPSSRSFIVLDVDIPEFNSCSSYHFDNFNRPTTSPAVGFSDTGSAWTSTSTTSGTSIRCDGQYLTWTGNAINSGQCEPRLLGAGPWTIGETFTFETRIRFTYTVSQNRLFTFGLGATAEPVSMSFAPRTGGDVRLRVSGSATSDEVLIAYTSGTWYRLKWEHDPANNVSRCKAWVDGTAEPGSWTVSRDPSADNYGASTDEFSIFISNASSSASAWTANIDWIDFNAGTAGHGCNGHSIDGTVLDDFDRSIAVGNALLKWGNTSGSGDPWTNVTDGSNIVSYGVDNGEAIARFTHDGSGTTQRTLMMTLNEGGSGLSPFFTTGAGVPDELFDGDLIDWAIDFMCTDIQPNRFNYLEFDWTDNNTTGPIDGVLVGVAMYDLASPVRPYIDLSVFDGISPADIQLGTGYFQSNVWYTVRVQKNGTAIGAKVWQSDSFEPGWQVFAEVLPGWTAGEFTIWGNHREISSNTNVEEYRFRNFRLMDSPCDPQLVTLPSSGRVCEDFTGDGSTTDFMTAQTQQYGVTSVSVNGIYQTTHQYDQIEVGGNLVGVSMLVAPPAAADVHVCYTVGEGIGPFSLGPV